MVRAEKTDPVVPPELLKFAREVADGSSRTTEALEKLPLMGMMPQEPQAEPGALKSTSKKVSGYGLWRHTSHSSGVEGVCFHQ